MANLTVNPSTITVTDKTQNTVTVNFTCDKTLTDIKLSMDNGSTYKDKNNMTQNSATFDITGLSNNNYTCYLKGFYEEAENVDPLPPNSSVSIKTSQTNYTMTVGADTLSVPVTITGTLPAYPVWEVRQNNSYFLYCYKDGNNINISASSLSIGTYNNLTIVAKDYVNGGYVDIAISNTFSITVTSSSNSDNNSGSNGDSSGGTTNTNADILSYMYPMPQSHECIPNGAPSDWKYQSRWENKDKPAGWSAFGGWAQVYRVEGTPFTQNTGVEIKDYKVYGWKNGQWHSVIELPYPSGNFYAEDFTDDANSYFSQGIKPSDDRKSVIIRLTSDMTVSTSQGTKYVCYHPFTAQLDYDTDFEYIFTCVSMRKVKWDASGVDDINTTRYCASCGGDWWRQKGLTWAPDWSNNKGIAQPKISEVTADWKIFAMTTVPENWANGFPV